ncbi:MAG: GDP-mannose 4,6-dehydratase [Candidatus Obscuribacterales bacterium]|nr:GDP-mannose 4,6-dehydratase [Steroidobacteraceae bacterium]
MPKALVLGVNGQDGSYLAESLLKRGYDVAGVARQSKSRYVTATDRFAYVQLDLQNADALRALLETLQPDVVFHAAAIHGAAGFCYEPVFAAMLAVNVTTVHSILEYARMQRPGLRFVYANSSKIFPSPLAGSISEQTPIAATCLYSIGKIAALDLIRHYRRQHGSAAANLILFNHESRRRPENFFVPMLVRGLAAAMANPKHLFPVKTLDFYADWSSAEELMDIAIDIAEQAPAEDFVLASAVSWHARVAAQKIFSQRGLDYSQHIQEALPRSNPGNGYQVCIDHLAARIGRRPVRDFSVIVDDLLQQMSAD